MILSLEIDRIWTAWNLAKVLIELDRLAHLVETGKVENDDFNISISGSVHVGNVPRDGHLRIFRLAFNSPGFVDLAGAGKVVEQARIFIQFLIEWCSSRNDRYLDREERKIEIASKRVELVKQLYDLHPHLVPLVEKGGTDALIEAVYSGRITGVSVNELDEST